MIGLSLLTTQIKRISRTVKSTSRYYTTTGKVGDIVDRTIDEPFYRDMDTFVKAMRNSKIAEYKTSNRIGATEMKYFYAAGSGQSLEIP